MDYDTEKVEEMAMALHFLTSFEEYGSMRAWKEMDWEVLDRLHEKGFLSNPENKSKSVVFTEEGYNGVGNCL